MEYRDQEDIVSRLNVLHYIQKLTWKQVAATGEFGRCSPGSLSSIAAGREIGPKLRLELNMVALVPAPACPKCGLVHVKPNCVHDRKPRAIVVSMSDVEAEFLFFCRALEIPEPETEYRFDELRDWRFDFVWPEYKRAVEMEGGVYKRGRHTRGKGYEDDCEKYNEAAMAGWMVLRFTLGMLKDGRADKQLSKLWKDYKDPERLWVNE